MFNSNNCTNQRLASSQQLADSMNRNLFNQVSDFVKCLIVNEKYQYYILKVVICNCNTIGVSNAASERTRGGNDVTNDEDECWTEPSAPHAAEHLRHVIHGPGHDGDGVPAAQGGGRHQADDGDAGLQSGGHPGLEKCIRCHEYGEPTIHGGEEIRWIFNCFECCIYL